MEEVLFKSALLVEDEAHLATTLKIALRKLGIPVTHASTLAQAAQQIQLIKPDFILLDRNLPDGDGLELCASLRDQGFRGCILMLTARGETRDRVDGLTRGADDYLTKPFSWDELHARICALARRARVYVETSAVQNSNPESTWFKDEKLLRIKGPKEWVVLTPLEFKLAVHLMDSRGAIVSRDHLLKEVWGFTLLPKTRTVDHFLGRLRKHFEENPEEPQHFLTVRGAGYRFVE